MDKEFLATHIAGIFSKYYSPVDMKAVRNLVNLAEEYEYKKGRIILQSGDPYHKAGYVYKGLVRSYYIDMDGNDITKGFFIEDSLFMDESLLNYANSICTYEALEDSTVFMVDAQKVKSVMMENDYLKRLYIASLEESLKYKIMRESEFLLQNATERYLNFLKRYPRLDNRVRQSYIASYLGITPESLSRIRRFLREKNKEI